MTDNQMLVSQMNNVSFGDIFCTFILIFIIVFGILFIKQSISNLFKFRKELKDLKKERSAVETKLKGLNKTEKK